LSIQLEYRMPYEYPKSQPSSFEIPTGASLSVILRPRMITSGHELRHYSVTDRKCYFSDEVRLKYFFSYTKILCELECEIDLILELCGCLLHIIEGIQSFQEKLFIF
jgi:acid-sensing ion channel, other